MIAAAGSWQDLDALVRMVRAHAPCCIKIAALHAARRGHIDAVRALMAALPVQEDGNMRTIYNALHGMWSLVGRHGLVTLGRFLLDMETGADPVIRFTAKEREHLARVRSGDEYQYDFPWDWLHEAARYDQAACLDLCIERGLPTQPTEWAGTALFSKSATFYAKMGTRWDLEAYGRSLFMYNALHDVAITGKPLREGALLWIVSQPEFDPLLPCAAIHHDLPTDDKVVPFVEFLFYYARNYYDTATTRSERVQAAAVVAQRWPDVWTDFGEWLCLRSVAIAAESDMKVDDCIP
ncbi:hypothetical protein TW95_gp0734 [Pandoravirus inopinatum]|uniref:Uncharacterized protein n=1 Tax=Pandoravirus inopinatum TaxID=1605721 RepID=A0A0B5IXH7_9VIRU|nr:hypothetical protein TW95_gp0734 [Pandoravirus inopinatum]AJF97468.1 hypothetical protein [Pandoravirus inopinatum]